MGVNPSTTAIAGAAAANAAPLAAACSSARRHRSCDGISPMLLCSLRKAQLHDSRPVALRICCAVLARAGLNGMVTGTHGCSMSSALSGLNEFCIAATVNRVLQWLAAASAGCPGICYIGLRSVHCQPHRSNSTVAHLTMRLRRHMLYMLRCPVRASAHIQISRALSAGHPAATGALQLPEARSVCSNARLIVHLIDCQV